MVGNGDAAELQAWLRASNTKRSLATRARVILLSQEGLTGEEVAEEVGLTPQTVYKWRSRYLVGGLAGLVDLPRPGQPKRLSEEARKRILTLTVERIPEEATHWSIALMARYAAVTTWHVRQVWEQADLQPHRLKGFKISNDPHFADKVIDVVGLYMNPPVNAGVLSVDEKTQIQAVERTRQALPLAPGHPETQTHDYKRHGTASLYAAFDIASGHVIGKITDRHRAVEFIGFLDEIDSTTNPTLDLHVILDNSSTHKTQEVKAWLEAHPRFKLHFTPTSASWLNAVEGWFGKLERRALYRNSFSNVRELRDAIRHFIRMHNRHTAKPFKWTKSASTILEKVDRARDAQNRTMAINRRGH